jgi:hypothetical protein
MNINVHPHARRVSPTQCLRMTHKQEILSHTLKEPYQHIWYGFRFNTIACSHNPKWDMRHEDCVRLIYLTEAACPMT